MTTLYFLDDERHFSDVTWMKYVCDQCIVFTDPQDFVECVTKAIVAGEDMFLSFDHDLQFFDAYGKELTGKWALEKICMFCIESNHAIPDCVFHTKNPVGRQNMQGFYKSAIDFQKKFG